MTAAERLLLATHLADGHAEDCARCEPPSVELPMQIRSRNCPRWHTNGHDNSACAWCQTSGCLEGVRHDHAWITAWRARVDALSDQWGRR